MKGILYTTWMIILLKGSVCFGQAIQRDVSNWLVSIKLEPKPPPCYKVNCPGYPYSDGVITFQNGKVDISAFVERAETLLQQSDYQNNLFFENLQHAFKISVKDLCHVETYSENQIQSCETEFERSLEQAEMQLRESQVDRILLPNTYDPVGHLSDQVVSKAHQKLALDCLTACSDTSISSLLSHGNQDQYQEAVRRLSEKGPDCLKNALAALGRQIQTTNESNLLPNSCENERGQRRRVCNRWKHNEQIIIGRLSNLTDLILSQTSSQALQSLDTCLENQTSFSALEEFLKDLDDEMLCRPYQKGEERYISVWPGHYKLKREGDGSYTASLAISFAPADDYDNDSHVPKNQVNSYYKEKTRKCLNEASSKIQGPNGEQLNIVIEDVHQDSCLPEKQIFITAKNGYTDTSYYAADIICPTIAHEILHDLGLFDKYKESSRGYFVDVETGMVLETEDMKDYNIEDRKNFVFQPKFNCRVTQEESFMAIHLTRWNRSFQVSGRREDHNAYSFSLLDPAEFNAILYGNCTKREDVRILRECSRLAYTTSYLNRSSREDNCPPLKTECERQNVQGKSLAQIQAEERILSRRINSLNSHINNYSSKLMALEQMDRQTRVHGPDFECSYRNVDIHECKEFLEWGIKQNTRKKDGLIQRQERLLQIMPSSNP